MRGSTFSEIATDAENWYVNHGKKDLRTVKSRFAYIWRSGSLCKVSAASSRMAWHADQLSPLWYLSKIDG